MSTRGLLGAVSSAALCGGAFAVSFEAARRARMHTLERRHDAGKILRDGEALRLHDSVVQGLAAGIWMIDAGCNDGALDALTSTMDVAQRLVSECGVVTCSARGTRHPRRSRG